MSSKELLSLKLLTQRIAEVEKLYEIECVDVYGGEIGLLKEDYLRELLDLFSLGTHFNFITNFSVVNPVFYDERVQISVSWEGNIRRKWEKVYQNMRSFSKDIHLLMLASQEMISWDDQQLEHTIKMIADVESIKTVEIKPYSSNQANQLEMTFVDYENLIKRWLQRPKKFFFVNEQRLRDVFNGLTNSFSDDHLYINPKGEFCVLDFDLNDNEFFLPIKKIEDYLDWSNNEKVKSFQNSYCHQCEYHGQCLTEHIRNVSTVEKSCNGFIQLIDWYKESYCERV